MRFFPSRGTRKTAYLVMYRAAGIPHSNGMTGNMWKAGIEEGGFGWLL